MRYRTVTTVTLRGRLSLSRWYVCVLRIQTKKNCMSYDNVTGLHRAAFVTWVTSQRECCWDTNPSTFTSAYQTNRTVKSLSTLQLIFSRVSSRRETYVCILNAALKDRYNIKIQKIYTFLWGSRCLLIKLLTFLLVDGNISVLNFMSFSMVESLFSEIGNQMPMLLL